MLAPKKVHVLASRMVDVLMIDALLCFSVGSLLNYLCVFLCFLCSCVPDLNI